MLYIFLKPNTGKLKNYPQQWDSTYTARVIEYLGVGNIERKVPLPSSLLLCSTRLVPAASFPRFLEVYIPHIIKTIEGSIALHWT